MTIPILHGPSHVPADATHALVCLHGFGDEGASYLGLWQPLQSLLPVHVRLAVFCPNGPAPMPFGQGYQWFSDKSWTFRDRDGLDAASHALWTYLHAEIVEPYGIPLNKIVVLGFSQGAMTVLYAAPRWEAAVGGVVAHSGLAMWQEYLNPKTCQKPPFLLLHGQEDDMISADQTVNAAHGLVKLGFQTEQHIIPHLAHGINGESLAYIGVFLQGLWSSQESL